MIAAATGEKAYWRTSVSRIEETEVSIRGYSLEDLIGQLPFSAAAYLLIRGELPSPRSVRVLDAVLSAVLDYGLEKPGTVAARYVMSANPNMAAGIAAAVLAVGKNTLAPEDTARFAIDSYQRYLDSGEPADSVAEQIVAEARAARRRIPGLGHPVFKDVDPRAAKLKAIAVEAGLWGERAQFYEAVHAAFRKASGKADIPVNDVGVMALVLVELGFTPDETTGLAIISTLPGVVAHLSEEQQSGRRIRVAPRSTVDYDIVGKEFEHDWKEAGW